MNNFKKSNNDPQMEAVLEQLAKQGITPESGGYFSVKVEGVLPDFVWYESESIIRQLDSLKSRIKHLTSVMEARSKDQNKTIEQLMAHIKELKAQK